jgi:transcriptional regulator with XRE-family HTH domain
MSNVTDDPADRFYRLFGANVRAARSNADMTQDTLARKIGMTRSSVANLEAGRQRIPLHLLYEIASALRVEPRELLPDVRDETPLDLAQLESDLRDHTPEDRAFVRAVVEAAQSDRPR